MNKKNKNLHRVNDDLRGNYDVRVIVPQENGKNENLVMKLENAKQMAYSMELDIFEINSTLTPPLLRIDNYSSWLYHEKKKLKENKQKPVNLKEIQLTVNIGKSDLEVKAKKAKEFINNGDKVKVILTLKRREQDRLEESKRCLYEFILLVNDVAVPESLPKDNGNKSIVILKKKK